jgi:hypothetical protein
MIPGKIHTRMQHNAVQRLFTRRIAELTRMRSLLLEAKAKAADVDQVLSPLLEEVQRIQLDLDEFNQHCPKSLGKSNRKRKSAD